MGVKGSRDSSQARIQSCKSEQLAVMPQARGDISKDESTFRDRLHPALSQSCVNKFPFCKAGLSEPAFCHQQLKTKLGNSRNEVEQKNSRGENLEQGPSTWGP